MSYYAGKQVSSIKPGPEEEKSKKELKFKYDMSAHESFAMPITGGILTGSKNNANEHLTENNSSSLPILKLHPPVSSDNNILR